MPQQALTRRRHKLAGEISSSNALAPIVEGNVHVLISTLVATMRMKRQIFDGSSSSFLTANAFGLDETKTPEHNHNMHGRIWAKVARTATLGLLLGVWPALVFGAVPSQRNLIYTPVDSRPFFDIPVTYNTRVKSWITHFQGPGRKWYRTWLERSHRYLPVMQKLLRDRGLPQDLAYVAMIESGFSPHAVSTAEAVGYWQFIKPTASRYGLQVSWWLDERRDFQKSTNAAAAYLGDLYRMFGSWYLTAAAYNMGEGRLKRLIQKHRTNNFWELSKRPDFPAETRDYIPKMLAAMLIAKLPKLYGFNDLRPHEPHRYDYFYVPGGTDLINLANYLKVDPVALQRLNPELIKGFIPTQVRSHRIRIPTGYLLAASNYVRLQL